MHHCSSVARRCNHQQGCEQEGDKEGRIVGCSGSLLSLGGIVRSAKKKRKKKKKQKKER